AGWLREETQIMGGDFDHRWSQTRESILAMKELWTKREAEFHGKYYDFPPVRSYPKPAQKPHPPVLLGGGAKNVLQRIVAWGDGWLPNRITPDQLRESRATLDRLAKEAGRDPSAITISVHGQPADRDLIKRLHDAGATRVIVRPATVVVIDRTGYAVSDASRAIDSMMLTAWAEGVGSNWVGFGNLEKVNALLGIPSERDVLAILPFGYPADRIGRGKKKRKPLR